jgi:hypothetical protein
LEIPQLGRSCLRRLPPRGGDVSVLARNSASSFGEAFGERDQPINFGLIHTVVVFWRPRKALIVGRC